MRNKLNIILFSPYLPAPNTSACARKIYDSIKLLHLRGYRIYLLSFCSKQDKEKVDLLRPYCAEIHLEEIGGYSRYPRSSSFLSGKITSLCQNKVINILQCEKAYMGRYLPLNTKVPCVLVEHEILSDSFSERAKLESNIIKKIVLFSRKLKKHAEEKKWYGKFNQIIVFSEYDKGIIKKSYNFGNVAVIPLGVNLDDYPVRQEERKSYDLMFVGNFSHRPNIDAVEYFYEEILPLIREKAADISVIFAGTNPPVAIKRISEIDKKVFVTGYINDLAGVYAKARVFIVPIRYGTGMRYKILEAMASGVPVVSTSIGARGIMLNGSIEIADTQKEFADAVISLLKNPDIRHNLTENSRLDIEKSYNWSTLLDKYEDIYDKLVKIN